VDRGLAILLAAEQLFAERGFHAVSMRDIAALAGVPLALVGYYYGHKIGLYQAIFESWQDNIERRRARLDEAMHEPRHPQALERVLAAFVEPLVALHAHPEGRHFAAMAARDLAAPTPESDAIHRTHFDPMAHAFIDALQHLFATRSRADVAWCYQWLLGATLHFLADKRVQRLSQGTAAPADPAQVPRLVAFVAAGFRAALAVSAEPPAKRRAARKSP
jgi:AcrR family transcriptional regulator